MVKGLAHSHSYKGLGGKYELKKGDKQTNKKLEFSLYQADSHRPCSLLYSSWRACSRCGLIFGKIISKSSCAKVVQYVRLEVKTFFNFLFCLGA